MEVTTEQLIDLLRAGTAAPQVRSAIAKGALPLTPVALLEALDILADDPDPAIGEQAQQSLGRLPLTIVRGVVSAAATSPELLDRLARRFADNEAVVQDLVLNGAAADGTTAFLATLPFPALLEVIGRNQARLDRAPEIVANLLANEMTPTTIVHLWQEHVERRAGPAKGLAVPTGPADFETEEPIPAEFHPVLMAEEEEPAPAAVLPEEAGAALTAKQLSIYQLLKKMTMGQKVALAVKGNREVRNLLIHETNKMLCLKVLENPRISDTDIEAWAKATNMSEDVLRGIANKKEWVKKYSILKGLVFNPKTPLGITLDLVKRLVMKDLELLTKNRNVPETLRTTARRLFVLKRDANR